VVGAVDFDDEAAARPAEVDLFVEELGVHERLRLTEPEEGVLGVRLRAGGAREVQRERALERFRSGRLGDRVAQRGLSEEALVGALVDDVRGQHVAEVHVQPGGADDRGVLVRRRVPRADPELDAGPGAALLRQ
jgi:hypothetical protein